MMLPTLFTIPPDAPFVDRLAAGLLACHGADPLDLGGVTVLLPNRRAVRALADAFLRQTDGQALLLPAMRAIGDVDAEEVDIGLVGGGLGDSLDLPPEIPPLIRKLLLARQVARWAEHAWPHAIEPAQAARLAHELARFLDRMQTEEVPFDALEELVPAELAAHWQKTLGFLKILVTHWPAALAETGHMDAAARRAALLAVYSDALAENPPGGPIYAAGSTGSIPATAALLGIIARLPAGTVILPGLDRDMDAESWEALGETHPQFALKRLLMTIGANRDEVADWPHGAPASPAKRARLRLVTEAMQPAETTDRWPAEERQPAEAQKQATDGLSLIACPERREEAGVIALVMREALETSGKRAALITPDRRLAAMVAAALGRWGLEVDDSAGRPLGLTPPAVFLRLLAEAAQGGLAPVPLLALLKHPLCAGGMARDRILRLARWLDKDVLRGPRPRAGFGGLKAAARDIVGWRRYKPDLERIETALTGFVKAMGRKRVGLAELVDAHLAVAEALAATDTETGSERLWAGEDGEVLAGFLSELTEAARHAEALPGAAYPALFEALIADRVVRPRFGAHPRLAIWGPIEARLQQADVVILGGLNEGTWPAEAAADPWLSRPMTRALGLPTPEQRIGQAAHDFCQALGADEVVLTRAEKVDGTPTVPSRWLLRLQALAGPLPGGRHPWLAWEAKLNASETAAPWPAPEPRPPLEARPRRLSVTGVEAWMRDPYAVYARYILRLRPLDKLDGDPGAAERGTFVHKALESALKNLPGPGGVDFESILEHGRAAFGPALDRPAVAAFWWPRFEAIARWFWERQAERVARPVGVEIAGELVVPGVTPDFTLTATADRIDRLADGRLEIIDYKTGQPPSAPQVAAGFAPQLPLEGLMAARGAFDDLPAAEVAALTFWHLTGKFGEPASERAIKDVTAEITKAEAGLAHLIAAFDKPDTAYLSNPRPALAGYGDYDHLARVKEWQFT